MTNRLRVGFTYNQKRIKAELDGTGDEEAEYDAPTTLEAIREAIRSFGHEVVDLEATRELPALLAKTQVDVIFNMAEGTGGRNRESQVPALLEMLDIPYTGSDPATLAIALDKSWAKRVVSDAGVRVPGSVTMSTGREPLPAGLRFPLIVKPNAEGSSKGVHANSVVHSERSLRSRAKALIARYEQPALVEEYIAGRELTVGLLGSDRPRVLPPLEIVFLDRRNPTPVYAFEHKQDWSQVVRYEAPARLTASQLGRLEAAARDAFLALRCRDVARLDFRMDRQGRFYFIECNPIPGLAPDWSDLATIAKAAGMDHRALIGEILAPVIQRHRARATEKRRFSRAG